MPLTHFGDKTGTVMATLEKRDSGWWQAKIRRKGHPVQSKSFERKTDAETWARDVEGKMDRGIFVDRAEAESTSLGDAIRRYMVEVSEGKKGKSAELVRFRWWLTDPLSSRSLASLKSKDFAKWRDNRAKTVSAATCKRDLSIVSHVFTICRKEWGIDIQNPMTGIRMPVVRNARSRRLEEGEEVRLFAALRDSGKGALANVWMLPLVQLAIETAMRQGEMLAIRWEDVREGFIHLADTKNGTERNVPLSSRARAILAAMPRSIRGKVFATTQTAVAQSWRRALARAGIEGLTFHDLRHEATSRLAEKLALHELMKVTGHQDTKMLARYYHPRAEDLAKKLG